MKKWILLVSRRNAASVLAYEFDSEEDAQALFRSTMENSSACVRLFLGTLVCERPLTLEV